MCKTQPSQSLVPVLLALAIAACGSPEGADEELAEGLAQNEGGSLLPSAPPRNTAPSAANLSVLGVDNRKFAFDLYHEIAATNAGENLIFSPYSISTALAMAYAGARTATAAEMKATLHFELAPDALHEAFNAAGLALASRGKDNIGAAEVPFRLGVSNGLWAQAGEGATRSFLNTLGVNYGVKLRVVDFTADPDAARAKINAQVAQETELSIPELLPPKSIKGDTNFVLTNAVYFNASWQKRFNAAFTRNAPFTKLNGQPVTTPIMVDTNHVPYLRGEDFQAIALPYASADLSFVAVLPDAGKFESVERALSQPWFDQLQAGLAIQSVRVGLPKLDYKSNASLVPALQALGMNVSFSEYADFSGIRHTPLTLTEVVHGAAIQVFEGGTVAAAATAVVIGPPTASPQRPVDVTFDRPFVYAVVDAPTGQVLFLGRVLDPTAK